jgi:glycosyltransferase involved in cell wall biosynthesis
MKIMLYNPLGATIGHAQDYVDNICKGLLAHRVDLSLVTSSNFFLKDGVATSVSVYRASDSSEVFGEGTSILQSIKYAYWLIRSTTDSINTLSDALKKESPDVCMFIGGASLINALILPFYIKKFSKTLFSLTLHNVDLDWRVHKKFRLKTIYKYLQATATKQIAKNKLLIHCHGEYMMGLLRNSLEPHSAKISFYPVPNTGVVKKFKKNIIDTPKTPVLLFFGVIRLDKGLDILCDALSLILDRNWKLVIAGSAQQVGVEYVRNCVKALPQDRVELDLRYFSDEERDAYYSQCSIVCIPYRNTFMAQSVVMVDAMRLHRPVISTTCSENGANTVKYGVGWVFESENIQDLIKSLDEALARFKCIPEANFSAFNLDHEPDAVGAKILKSFEEYNESN